jgi:hypothetical protein
VSRFALSFGRLEAVLSAYFRIDPERGGTFRARIKQLQRLNFPGGVNVGRGVKFEYGLDHALKLVVALELMSFGLPAKFVSELVEASWRRIAIAFQISPIGMAEPFGASEIFGRFNIDVLGDAFDHSDCVEVYDQVDFQFHIVNKGENALFLNMTAIFKRFVSVLDLIRMKNTTLGFTARKWDTGYQTLSEEVPWDIPWLHVSDERLSYFTQSYFDNSFK